MADDSRSGHTVRGRAPGDPDRHAPRQWIYENLTPWRIHARFTAAGELVPRTQGDDGADEPPGSGPPCEECVVRVLSIPALGEVKVPREDALLLNTLHMRRLGQIEVRPAPSELLTNLPRAIVIFGWLVVLLLFGGWALLAGGASSLPWEWVVASVVVVPVVALAVAAVREIQLYRRFSRYRAESGEMARGAVRSGSGRRSLEGIERGSRIRAFVDGVPRHAAEVAIFVGAIVVSVVGLGMAIHLTTQLNDLLPVDYGALLRLDDPFVDVSEVARNSPAFWQLVVGHVAQWILVSVAAFTPVAMYFQFDRQRLASVERRWVQEVFRLDPTVRTVRDIRRPVRLADRLVVRQPRTGLRSHVAPRPAVAGDRGDDPARARMVPRHLDHPGARPRRGSRRPGHRRRRGGQHRARLVDRGRERWRRRLVPGVDLLPAPADARRLRVPRLVRLRPAPRAPRLPAARPPSQGLQHGHRQDPGGLRARAGRRGGLRRTGRRGHDVLRRVHAPERARVAEGEALGERRGLGGRPAARTGAAHRPRGDRPLRPHPPGRGGHRQHPQPRPRRHRGADEQHQDLGGPARGLDRPGDPVPAGRW